MKQEEIKKNEKQIRNVRKKEKKRDKGNYDYQFRKTDQVIDENIHVAVLRL